ncbi:MAG: nucleoside deaminase [Candidatus Saelkia tenebricola]|nr:nucleoside deaminase [Candidatus Saelkia tenebricola]
MDEKFMSLAIEEASRGVKNGQTPFGACIVRGEEVIVSAHNVVWQDVDITAHAEINAIRGACKKLGIVDLSGYVIYSTCEPCPMCFSACHWAKISKIVYGVCIEDAQKFGFSELTISNDKMVSIGGSLIEITGGILKEENLELFGLWSERKDKKVY